MRIPSGVTDQYIYFVAVDATDLKTRETGLSSFTVRRSRNGAASAAYTTPTINETDSSNMPGVYELLLDEDMTIGSGNDSEEVCLHITHAGMAPVTRVFELYRPKITEGETLTVSSSALPWNAAWDAEVQSECTDALNAYDPPTNAEMVARTLAAADYATATALQTVDNEIATIDGVADAIKAKTDSLTFTVAGKADANITHVNEVEVTGDGETGTEWGPA